MAVVRAQEASSSTSGCTYQVFLSFRGEDTRRAFTSHLYTALVQAGLHTFRDDDEIERGEKIKSELEKGLQQSRASIIVFSKDYASSSWCLNELVMILERRSSYGHLVLPVFYDVEPRDIRKQLGSIGESFAIHEEKITSGTDEKTKKELMDLVERWRGALEEAADLGGMELKNQADGDESKFIQKVVNVIQDKLGRKGLDVPRNLVGIHSRTNNINWWLQDGSTNVGLMVICGMGGIGKTTIAKFAFNQNFKNFDCSSFLGDVRERSKEPKGLIHLQEQFLSDICKRRNEKIHYIDKGINKIIDAICCKRILLVLDDVDHVDQFDALFSMRDKFYAGSKIIVTTRYEHLLKPYEVDEVCKVEALDFDDSVKLFSFYAFGQDHPTEKYMELTEKIVAHCGGLPLALEVFGSSLFGKNVGVWMSQLKKLETIANSHIVEKLKISFDSLQDDDVKNIFLHIACLFDGTDKDCTINILDACGMHTIVGIEHLIDRSLLAIDLTNKLKMHQLIRHMGRDIVRQESPDQPEKRSVLWHARDCFSVLREKIGTETIKAMAFDMCMYKKITPVQSTSSTDITKRGTFNFLFWHPVRNTVRGANEYIESDAFARMKKLKLLQLNYVKLSGSYKRFPNRLRWLCWHGFHLESIPSDLSMESLVSLDMQYSSLKKLWKGSKVKYEIGIFSTILRGLEIPDWFNNRKMGSSISFTVPSLPNNPPIRGLSVCFVTRSRYGEDCPSIKISNKTKDIIWSYGNMPSRIPKYGGDSLLLSHWKLGNLLEAGDEVTVSCEDTYIQVRECGIKLVYNEDEEEEERDDEEETKEMTQQHDTTYLSWAEQTLTELSQLHDSGTSYYFGDPGSDRGACLRGMKHFTRNLYYSIVSHKHVFACLNFSS